MLISTYQVKREILICQSNALPGNALPGNEMPGNDQQRNARLVKRLGIEKDKGWHRYERAENLDQSVVRP